MAGRFSILALTAASWASLAHAAPALNDIDKREVETVVDVVTTTVTITVTGYPPTATPDSMMQPVDEDYGDGDAASDDDSEDDADQDAVNEDDSEDDADQDAVNDDDSEDDADQDAVNDDDSGDDADQDVASDDSGDDADQDAANDDDSGDDDGDESASADGEDGEDSAPAPNVDTDSLTSGDKCVGGNSCEGKITYWMGGLGACGDEVDTANENAIALPHLFMGEQSNGNPYCNRKVTVVNPTSGTTVKGVVKDKCMSCDEYHIDLTKTMFDSVTDGQGDGMEEGFEWYLE